MRKPRVYLFAALASWVTILSLMLNACNFAGGGGGSPTPTQPPPEVFFTAAAQTIAAGQMTQSVPTTAAVPPTVTLTPLPTSTPTLELTNTPAFTPTPTIPMISASVSTNCRLGPDVLYEPPVGVLPVGKQVEVHGRNDAGTWWYIQNPSRSGQFCWVWGETTKVEGSTAGLPIITPPPKPPTLTFTPTPSFAYTAAYNTVHDCGGSPTAIFTIQNTGNLTLHSMSLKIEDTTASTVLYGPTSSDAPFMGAASECPPGGDTLKPGKTFYIGGAIGSGHSGHTAKATIHLCTENGLKGTCGDKTVEFTIP
jgi:hypothetical protein